MLLNTNAMFFVDFVVCRYSTCPIFEFPVFSHLNSTISPLWLKVKVSPGYFINLWTVLLQPGKTRTCKNFFPPVAISDGLGRVIYCVCTGVAEGIKC